MPKYLVIVESPTKVKTIRKFLGKNYAVMASNGHVRDLPKSQVGVDIAQDFEPKYITIRGKGELLASLRKEAKKADKIYLATDPDREGEAISWHLVTALNLENRTYQRITFNEITKNAVKNSLKNPRDIDMDLVDAQQARRVLDRVVGYEISPLLWAKVKRGLSAGRVQSVALRIICDREKEINDFIPREYYTLDAILSVEGEKQPLAAAFYGDKSGKLDIDDKESLDGIMKACEKEAFRVDSVNRRKKERKSPLPFTTSTMQQEASKALNFSVQKTMRVAQQLYEGIDIKGHGTVGLITYLRTDSTRVSAEAQAAASDFIKAHFGEEYLAAAPNEGKSRGNIQDAHEAIRPADIALVPSEIRDSLSRDQLRLYQLIWKRFVASRMTPAVFETTTIRFAAGEYVFSSAASKRVFDGYMQVYTGTDEKEEAKNRVVGNIDEKSKVKLAEFDEKQHFTQAPAHFTEASLVRTLEELGIGRPSTYSPTISTILKRHYIAKEGKNLIVTELGEVVDMIMRESFPKVVDKSFTADMETRLDEVEEGKLEWKDILRDFYPEFETSVQKAEKEIEKVKIEDEVTDVICENCGRNMVIKFGPHGKFLACPGFPECRNTKPYLEKIGVQCPKCGKDIVARRSPKGRRFYGCEGYPECDFVSWQMPVKKKCPDCGGYMVIKGKNLVCANRECGHVEANTAQDDEP
ncbi:MAG: type I DNA topoisomerase [Lachnospiraceae bacterium]|nr:type I DNA topoisomerase [Lachnospiraceae bacterium]